MVYLILTKNDELNIQTEIVKYLSDNFDKSIKVQIIVTKTKHIIESLLSHINSDSYVFWHPTVASDNLALVKQYRNSIVIIKRQTVYIQKTSKFNPINENMAINHNFKIMYLSSDVENTNIDYKTVLDSSQYTINIEKLNNQLLNNPPLHGNNQ